MEFYNKTYSGEPVVPERIKNIPGYKPQNDVTYKRVLKEYKEVTALLYAAFEDVIKNLEWDFSEAIEIIYQKVTKSTDRKLIQISLPECGKGFYVKNKYFK